MRVLESPGFFVTKRVGTLFFGNLAKFASGQIYSRIWWMPAQLRDVGLIKDKTNAADL